MGGGIDQNENLPYNIPNSSSWVDFWCNGEPTFAITNTGQLWGAGENTYGVLGIGSNASYSPVFVRIGTAWSHPAEATHGPF